MTNCEKNRCTYRWQISKWFNNDAEWNAGIFACLVSARNPVRSAPHQRLIRIKKRIVNSRFLHDLLLLLNLLLFERLLHGSIILRLLLAACRPGMHVGKLVLSGGRLNWLLHLSLWLVAEWLRVALVRELKRKQIQHPFGPSRPQACQIKVRFVNVRTLTGD